MRRRRTVSGRARLARAGAKRRATAEYRGAESERGAPERQMGAILFALRRVGIHLEEHVDVGERRAAQRVEQLRIGLGLCALAQVLHDAAKRLGCQHAERAHDLVADDAPADALDALREEAADPQLALVAPLEAVKLARRAQVARPVPHARDGHGAHHRLVRDVGHMHDQRIARAGGAAQLLPQLAARALAAAHGHAHQSTRRRRSSSGGTSKGV
eukprot:7386374-Prymnesium_polylepis.1